MMPRLLSCRDLGDGTRVHAEHDCILPRGLALQLVSPRLEIPDLVAPVCHRLPEPCSEPGLLNYGVGGTAGIALMSIIKAQGPAEGEPEVGS
jgi:hypothetical protein